MENDVEVAILKERIEGIREQNKAQFDSIKEEMQQMRADMKIVLNFMNQNKGGLKVAIVLMTGAGAVGAGIMKLITLSATLH